jgi:tetratricopeptide (TPR) repeat protein
MMRITFFKHKILAFQIFGLMLLCANSGLAQDTTTAKIDSLIMLLMNDAEDPAKVDVYNALSDEYLNLNYQKSIEYTDLAVDLAVKLDYKEGLLKSRLAEAHLEMAYLLNYEKSRKLYSDILPLAIELKDRHAEMSVYKWLSYIYGAQKHYELAEEYNQKAMDIATELKSDKDLSDLHAYAGGLSEESGDTAKAIDHYAEVLAIERKNDFRETSNASMIVIARYYYLIDDPGQSLKYYRIALKNFERMNDVRWVSYTHAEMANLYIYKEDYKRAEQHALKGLEIAELNNFKKEIGDNCLVLTNIYTKIDSTEKAKFYQAKFDSIQASLNPIAAAPAPSLLKDEEDSSSPKNKMNGFLQAIILCIPVILFCLFMGRPTKKK